MVCGLLGIYSGSWYDSLMVLVITICSGNDVAVCIAFY